MVLLQIFQQQLIQSFFQKAMSRRAIKSSSDTNSSLPPLRSRIKLSAAQKSILMTYMQSQIRILNPAEHYKRRSSELRNNYSNHSKKKRSKKRYLSQPNHHDSINGQIDQRSLAVLYQNQKLGYNYSIGHEKANLWIKLNCLDRKTYFIIASQHSTVNQLYNANGNSTNKKDLPNIQQISNLAKVAGLNKNQQSNQSKIMIKKPFQIPSSKQLNTFIRNYKFTETMLTVTQLMGRPRSQIIFQTGLLYFGQIQTSTRTFDGFGCLIKEGYNYEGEWKDGKRTKGIEKTTTGVYSGSFVEDKRQGRGQFRWGNGQYYSGQWKLGKKHGRGFWKSPTGDSYLGQWKNGAVQGYGVHTTIKGQKYEGQFINYLKNGWGRQTFPNGDNYEGEYHAGMPHGKGTYIWKDESKYQGQFSQGMRQGYGVLVHNSGLIYKGNFFKEVAQGEGQIIYPNGDRYIGNFKNNKRHGQGCLRLRATNTILEGSWQSDEFIEQVDVVS